ncbi:thyrotropin-releasing hormone receptor-like [Babylonia areolata]|uniref:thyrotropin-releasing hormone receptor-like n=1 Tax=Babylonia areolata TaxID=304850 RepID=UPI003FCF4D3C
MGVWGVLRGFENLKGAPCVHDVFKVIPVFKVCSRCVQGVYKVQDCQRSLLAAIFSTTFCSQAQRVARPGDHGSLQIDSSSSSLLSSDNNTISNLTTTLATVLGETLAAEGLSPADNAETLRVVRYVVQKVCVPVVVGLGLLGNSLNMVVLTRRSMNTSTSCYLAALAAFDMVYLLCSLTLSFKHYSYLHRNALYVHWFPYGRVLSDMAANVSVLLTVTFTVERYIGVCHPIKGRLLCTPQRARVVIALVVLVAVVCTLPELFEMEVGGCLGGGGSYPTTQYTPFATSQLYQIGYYWFIATLFTFLPLLLLCVFNGILIFSLFKAAELRTRMTFVTSHPTQGAGGSREQHWITKMLVTVVLVFILCQLPGAILLLVWAYNDLAHVEVSARGKNQIYMAANVTNLLLQTNAAINFLLYSVTSSKFRRVFCRTLCPRYEGVVVGVGVGGRRRRRKRPLSRVYQCSASHKGGLALTSVVSASVVRKEVGVVVGGAVGVGEAVGGAVGGAVGVGGAGGGRQEQGSARSAGVRMSVLIRRNFRSDSGVRMSALSSRNFRSETGSAHDSAE